MSGNNVKGEKQMKRKAAVTAIAMAFTMGLSGCQENPDSSIVVNKDMDKLIEEAQSDEDTAGLEDMKQYDTWQTTLSDESLNVEVDVDAKVDIPETDQLSVIRVRQKQISQELLDQIRRELIPDEILYDGAILMEGTKSSIERDIADMKASMAEEGFSDEEKELIQSEIDDLQSKYEAASDEIVYKGNESNNQFVDMQEKQGDMSAFYEWAYSLNPDGQIYYGVNDAKNDDYISLYAQNNPERGNCLRYRRSGHGYCFVSYVVPAGSNLNDPYADYIWAADGEEPDFGKVIDSDVRLYAYEDETAALSLEAAVSMADEFLAKVGISDFRYYEGGLYNEIEDIRYDQNGTIDDTERENTEMGYSTRYILRYMRNVDDAFVAFDPTAKHEEGWDNDNYVKKEWPTECIEFRISDKGIVGFDYNAPLELTETVVDQSALKSFDEIKAIFEQMILVTNAEETGEEQMHRTLKIDRVKLGYIRVSEADSYDTGLLVPAWDFFGVSEDPNPYTGMTDETSPQSFLTVNAIDGSVIDRSLGY
jgi:hypothetical protein